MTIRILLLATILTAAASAQHEAFEVISVKPVPVGRTTRAESDCANGGRFISRGIPLLWSIKWAYDITDYQMNSGWPDWLNAHDAYDVEGATEARVTEDQCKQMIRSLFEQRFKLRMHHRTKIMSGYALVVSKGGAKLGSSGKVIINGVVKQASSEREAPEGWTMARLANYLAGERGILRPVVDRTGLIGTFSFKLNYSTRDGDDRPDIFGAVPQQLGLTLQPVKAPIEMWTIDHVERPSQN